MFYSLSKIAWFFVAPLNLFLAVVILCSLLLFTRLRNAARKTLFLTLAVMLGLILTPLNGYLLQSLEGRFPLPEARGEVEGILLLGANWQPSLTHRYGIAAVNNQPGRLVAFVHLGRLHPNARMIVVGGEARQDGHLVSDTVKKFMSEIGFPDERIEYFSQGRNTYETIRHAHEITEPKPDDAWLLVTSAFHMARSIGIARKLGWHVAPYPTDFSDTPSLSDTLSRFRILNTAMREWIGLAAYWVTDRTSEVYPGPNAT